MQRRVYVEYVPSDANISDDLSRDGVRDQWTQAKPWSLFTASCAPWHHLALMVWLTLGGSCYVGDVLRLLPWVFDLPRVGHLRLPPDLQRKRSLSHQIMTARCKKRVCPALRACRHDSMLFFVVVNASSVPHSAGRPCCRHLCGFARRPCHRGGFVSVALLLIAVVILRPLANYLFLKSPLCCARGCGC